ncbi:MAG: undecaprenyldiphospho-muramoylpentapeptide beta-N-acetylglucosaminyltransferase [Rudaea sp.]|nr:undecaprenyldiphospho-muramoylpentapeptide beta-N-acetylglucosaminyltransferase [Rudaea sp.]
MNAPASKPVLIMAGGTGGHIFPGIAVAQELLARGVPVLWLGSAGGLETRLVPQAGLPIETLAISGVRGKGALALLMAPLRILRALYAAWHLLGHSHVRSALALGGFAAGPGGIAAWLRGVPLLVHEQNRIPGVTNRILSHFSKTLLCGFSGSLKHAEWVGNPVRREIAALPSPQERLAGRTGVMRLLVLGGSQGARALNACVPQALAAMPPDRRPVVRHQCGTKLADAARAAYADARVQASVEPFIEDMAAAYAWADLIVCRAGALTLAELAAVGVGSVLVPFPFAVDDHQSRNADAMVAVGAALLLPEAEATGPRIAAVLTDLLGDRARLLTMAAAARTLAKPDAAARIADACLRVAA